jgi:hypothetical protein
LLPIEIISVSQPRFLNSFTIEDFETYKTLYQFYERDLAEIDIPQSSMYAYVTLKLSNNNNYKSPNFTDSDIEELWQEKLNALNKNAQNADL